MTERKESDSAHLSAEKIRQQFPYGAYIYYAPRGDAQRIHNTISQALPGVLVRVYNAIPNFHLFPQDCGIQCGDTFYGADAVEFYLKGLHVPDALLPHRRDIYRSRIHGGEIIHVGGSDARYTTHLDTHEMEAIFGNAHSMRPLFRLKRAIETIKQKYDLNSRNPRIFWENGQHEDLLATAFCHIWDPTKHEQWYIDSIIFDHLYEAEPDLKKLHMDFRSLPHECTRLGGLNIQYEYSRDTSEWLAFVPTLDALGPLADILPSNGYRLVELGNDQFSHGGGVKCKSLRIYWSTENRT